MSEGIDQPQKNVILSPQPTHFSGVYLTKQPMRDEGSIDKMLGLRITGVKTLAEKLNRLSNVQ